MSQPKLKRTLSLSLITFYGLGTILGAGIYVLIGKVAGTAGEFSHLSFLLAAFIAAFSAFSFAQMSKKFPLSAGEVVYVENGLRVKFLAHLVGYLVLITGTVSAAAIVRGFVGYLDVFVDWPDYLSIIVVLVALTGLALAGITESVVVATVVTLIEISGLLLIVFLSGEDILTKSHQVLSVWPDSIGEFNFIVAGAFLAFYAYIGFEDMVNVAEEVVNVELNLPRAIFIALVGSTILYILVALSALSALPIDQLKSSTAPIADIFVAKTGYSAKPIAVVSMLAIINGALVQIIMMSRVLFGMGKLNKVPSIFSIIWQKTGTPVVATVFVAATIALFTLFFPLETLAKLTSGVTLGIFILVNLSLFCLEWREKNRTFENKRNMILSFIGAVLCFSLLVY